MSLPIWDAEDLGCEPAAAPKEEANEAGSCTMHHVTSVRRSASAATQGLYSIEKKWLEFWLEKLLEFWFQRSYTKKKLRKRKFRHVS